MARSKADTSLEKFAAALAMVNNNTKLSDTHVPQDALLRTQLINELRELMDEQDRRETEALAVFRPLPTQLPFFLSPAPERLVRGGNRSGKTTIAATAFASELTRVPVTGPDGTYLPFQCEKHPKQTFVAYVIGYDEAHIGNIIYQKLFEPGLFMVIKDEATGKWRTFNRANPDDAARAKESRPCGPLIPPRLIDPKGWVWDGRAAHKFDSVKLADGTMLYAYPSSSTHAPQGAAVNLIWIDEDIKWAKHISELRMRLPDRSGKLIWSAWPHSSNDALVKMSERAENDRNRAKPVVHETVLKFSDNPFHTTADKKVALSGMSREEARARDLGEFTFDLVVMYPEFSLAHNGVFGNGAHWSNVEEDELTHYYRTHGEMFPQTWTRYMALDPGTATCAAIFAVIPPAGVFENHYIIIEDEIYQHQSTADSLAKEAKQKTFGKQYEAFLIDYRASRKTPEGFGKTVKRVYIEAFLKYGVESRATGASFIHGNDNPAARREILHALLGTRENANPIFRVVADATPHLQDEFKRYKRRVMPGATPGDPTANQEEPILKNNHLIDCCEYLAAYNPRFVAPTPATMKPGAAYLVAQEWKASQHKAGFIHLGAGSK